MLLEHIEHMICGSFHQLLALGKQKRLKHINCLSKVCHYHPVAVAIEDIQVAGCHDSVTHGVLLI